MMDGFQDVRERYERITNRLIEEGLQISTMESCTAGLIASLLTDTEGASATMKGSFITYSNEAKIACGVPEETVGTYGVYSIETARAMAAAARAAYGADIGIGVTGSFGNVDPANADSVPGELYYAIDFKGEVISCFENLPQQENRAAYKLYAAQLVGGSLHRCLMGETAETAGELPKSNPVSPTRYD